VEEEAFHLMVNEKQSDLERFRDTGMGQGKI
jgi:hypothetical protein